MIESQQGDTMHFGSKGWLSAATAERTRALVTAINAITIAASLKLAGQPQLESAELTTARELVRHFVRRVVDLVDDAQKDLGKAVVGADPQLTQIVRGLVAPAPPPADSGMSAEAVRNLPDLLEPSDDAEALQALVQDLRALRRLLEQYPAREARIR